MKKIQAIIEKADDGGISIYSEDVNVWLWAYRTRSERGLCFCFRGTGRILQRKTW